MSWRPMRQADLAASRALDRAFHVHHPEGDAVLPERLALAPEWCFVLDIDGAFAGYAITHPWGGELPPGLDTLLGALPENCDTLHVHDVVLVEQARGRGHAHDLVALLRPRARAAGLRRMTLIAVGEAGRFWGREGFAFDPAPERIAFVTASYGDGAPMAANLATPAASPD